MREVDLSGTRGYGGFDAQGNAPFASWREFLLDVAVDSPAKRSHGWRSKLEAYPQETAAFDTAHRRLTALVDSLPIDRHLVHMDLLHWNVLVEGDRITSVLDWGCGLYGDYLYDLAWLIFWQPWYPAWGDIDFRAEAQKHYGQIGLDVALMDERLTCCMIHMGLDGMAYQAWVGDDENLPITAQRTLEAIAAIR